MFLAKLEKKIAKFTKSSSQNFIDEFKIQLYSEPLIGIASASDPLWNKLKEPNVVNSRSLIPIGMVTRSKICYFLFSAIYETNSEFQSIRRFTIKRVALWTL